MSVQHWFLFSLIWWTRGMPTESFPLNETDTFLDSSFSTNTCPFFCFCDYNTSYVNCVGNSVEAGVRLSQLKPIVSVLEMTQFKLLTLERFPRKLNFNELKLSNNQIEKVSEEPFKSMSNLTKLDLSNNFIQSLSSTTFVGLEQSLRILDLSLNKLDFIGDVFTRLSQLQELNLNNNQIQKLTNGDFLSLTKLVYLNLGGNQLKVLDSGTFFFATSLRKLILSNNSLSSHLIDSLGTKLEFLDLTGSRLSNVPKGFNQYVSDLRLARNLLTRVNSEDFDGYPLVRLLILSDNQIQEIDEDSFGRLDHLQFLWLNGNKLKRIPIHLPASLLELYLQENQIQVIDEPFFRSLRYLRHLALGSNPIQSWTICPLCGLPNSKVSAKRAFVETNPTRRSGT